LRIEKYSTDLEAIRRPISSRLAESSGDTVAVRLKVLRLK